MKNLTEFLIINILNKSDFRVSEDVSGDKVNLTVVAPEESVRLLIGKDGKTIKNIRKILAIYATQKKQVVNINVISEAEPEK